MHAEKVKLSERVQLKTLHIRLHLSISLSMYLTEYCYKGSGTKKWKRRKKHKRMRFHSFCSWVSTLLLLLFDFYRLISGSLFSVALYRYVHFSIHRKAHMEIDAQHLNRVRKKKNRKTQATNATGQTKEEKKDVCILTERECVENGHASNYVNPNIAQKNRETHTHGGIHMGLGFKIFTKTSNFGAITIFQNGYYTHPAR